MFLKVDVNVRIKDNDIDDIMYTALNGGITYWCWKAQVVGGYLGEYASDQISRGGELKVYIGEPFDYEESETYTLNKELFLKGLGKYLEECGGFTWTGTSMVAELETYDFDAEAADMIIQYAIFDEIVYA